MGTRWAASNCEIGGESVNLGRYAPFWGRNSSKICSECRTKLDKTAISPWMGRSPPEETHPAGTRTSRISRHFRPKSPLPARWAGQPIEVSRDLRRPLVTFAVVRTVRSRRRCGRPVGAVLSGRLPSFGMCRAQCVLWPLGLAWRFSDVGAIPRCQPHRDGSRRHARFKLMYQVALTPAESSAVAPMLWPRPSVRPRPSRCLWRGP